MAAAPLRTMGSRWRRIAAIGCLAWATVALACESPAPGPPADRLDNLVLIVLDTFRGDIPSYAGGPASTPTLDALVRRGVWFRNARSNAPQTGPSHATLFTSQNVSEHGVHENGQIFAPAGATLAELLQHHGRRTAAFVSLGVLGSQFGFDRGFQLYNDEFDLRWWKDAEELNAAVLPWIEQSGPEPFFLWLHYSDTHGPYSPPDRSYPTALVRTSDEATWEVTTNGRPTRLSVAIGDHQAALTVEPGAGLAPGARFVAQIGGTVADACEVAVAGEPSLRDSETLSLEFSVPAALVFSGCDVPHGVADLSIALEAKRSVSGDREAYRLEVEYLDRKLGEVLAALESHAKLGRTLIVIVGDHGEGLGDHGLRRHGRQLYDSLLRVPLILVAPDVIPAGLVVDASASVIDVAPTIADLLSLPNLPEGRGTSRVPLVTGASAAHHPCMGRALASSSKYDLESVVLGPTKYIRDNRTGAEELFDVTLDPGELTNLAGIKTSDLVMMRDLLASLATGPEARAAAVVDPDVKSQLEALGYASPDSGP